MPALNFVAVILLLLTSLLPVSDAAANEAKPVDAAKAPVEIRLTPRQVEQDIELARETYQRIHPGYTRYTEMTELDAGWQHIVDRANREGGLSQGDFYLEISKALTLIRCDHTKAELPSNMSKDRDLTPVYLPAKIELIERRGFVRATATDSGLQVKDEIISIDGRPFAELLDKVEAFIPYDGYTEWSRESGLTESLEFKGGAIDHFGALLFDINDTATVNVRRKTTDSGEWQSLNIDVKRTTHADWLALKSSGTAIGGAPQETAANFKDGVFFSLINQYTAYLRVDTLVNYRKPVDPDELFSPLFKQLNNSGASTLILDLRRNGGGSNDAQRSLIAHLISKKIKPVREIRAKTLNLDGLREHLWTWDKRALNPNRMGFRKNDDGTWAMRGFVSDDLDKLKPAKHAFTGKVLVLTSTSNSSGSTSILTVIKQHADTTLIGGKTGGSVEGPTAGLSFTLTLPESKIKTRVPFLQTFYNVTEFEHGLGLTPDVAVTQTVPDYLKGDDTVLNTAIDFARNRHDDMK
ncbi:MAG: S41 family peptidase [Gammaproteobacteria bacterium]